MTNVSIHLDRNNMMEPILDSKCEVVPAQEYLPKVEAHGNALTPPETGTKFVIFDCSFPYASHVHFAACRVQFLYKNRFARFYAAQTKVAAFHRMQTASAKYELFRHAAKQIQQRWQRQFLRIQCAATTVSKFMRHRNREYAAKRIQCRLRIFLARNSFLHWKVKVTSAITIQTARINSICRDVISDMVCRIIQYFFARSINITSFFRIAIAQKKRNLLISSLLVDEAKRLNNESEAKHTAIALASQRVKIYTDTQQVSS